MFRRPAAAAGLASMVMLLLMTPAARAALGGDVASVIRDHQMLHASHQVTALANYDVHEGVTPAGLHIREYVDHTGREFALSWQSPGAANISSLLGDYAARYQAAARQHRTGHHLLTVNAADLSLSVARLPRGWKGVAILPQALPAGVSRADIR